MAKDKKFIFAFSGKEIFVIFSMLFFIAALLFTLGVIFGKTSSFDLSSIGLVAKDAELNEELNNEEMLNDENLNDEELADAEIDEFEKEDNLAEEKSEEKKAVKVETKEPKKQEKASVKKEEKLSFYKDLTQEKKMGASAPATKKNRYPMISEELLLSNRGKYSVQVAAYAVEKDAINRTLELKRHSCCSSAYYVQKEVTGKGMWYQVRIGFFSKLKNAKAFAKQLVKKRKDIKDYVIKVVR